ncbi:hypothetical protein [Romboutsia sp. Marseille-P6047]|uniref:hypothetical protein n=1 Tax=Romboutsia sp. Marseille-P6047 TaxID=2161817 RepID=UPI000F05678B|nr:hypothetical protein [Romboutsia sp. Marseille-P6047]
MDIKIHEFKKIISSPVIIGLTIVFLLFNIVNILSSSYFKEDIKIINKIILELGPEINDEMISNMKNKYKESLKEVNKITKEKVNKNYNSISEFIISEEYYTNNYDGGVFTSEELEFFNEVSLLEIYSNASIDLIKSYEELNIKEIGESEIQGYGLSGQAATMARKNYQNLSDRFEEIKSTNEHKHLFFLGSTYRMHSLLFRETLSKCIYEIMILVVLITAYLVNFEFDSKTNLLAYSTKRGRKNIKDKLVVCMIFSLLVSCIILGGTLLSYFTTFDYSQIWNIPISTAFNWEYKLPYISLLNHTFIERLVLSCLIILICALIFCTIAFIICTLIKNSYLVIFIFYIIWNKLNNTSNIKQEFYNFDIFSI